MWQCLMCFPNLEEFLKQYRSLPQFSSCLFLFGNTEQQWFKKLWRENLMIQKQWGNKLKQDFHQPIFLSSSEKLIRCKKAFHSAKKIFLGLIESRPQAMRHFLNKLSGLGKISKINKISLMKIWKLPQKCKMNNFREVLNKSKHKWLKWSRSLEKLILKR